ncbi:eCIS core domain-containing protein [Streptomyces sp. NPDC055254]
MRAQANDRGGSGGGQGAGRARQAQAPVPASGAVSAVSPRQVGALQRRIGNTAVARLVEQERRRHDASCDHDHDAPAVQRSAVHEVLRGAGRPLEEPLRREMEDRLGSDFSEVRLHTGAAAQRSAAEIGARAYTSGRDVVIGAAGGDKHTLAHELTHVIQQRRGPVSGTDNGAGLSVSDPSDAFEREAEVNAVRAMSRPRPELRDARPAAGPAHRSASGGSGAPVQRMLGFETEVSLPVENERGEKYEGDTDLAKSTAADFKVVSDKRSLTNGGGYSNVEFVTGAVPVVGSMSEAGPEALDHLVEEIRKVREEFYRAADKTPLQNMPLSLEILAEGAGARVAPGLGYTEHAGRRGLGDGLFVHYSVGVPLSGMPMFFDHLRDAAPATAGAPNLRARFRLTQAKAFASDVVQMYERGAAASKKRKRVATDALDGYSQLFFMQVAAVADYVAQDQDQGQIKNLTAVLSRSRLSDVRRLLDPAFQEFLGDSSEDVLDALAGYQEDSGDGGKLEFRENATRQIDGPEVSLIAFAQSALNGAPAVDQQSVFGGMNQIAPHQEEGAVMVPFEIRTMGATMKTWDQLKGELHDLARWAEDAYQHDRMQAGASNRRRTDR